jgi:DNA-binding beta-propeller fold protein YncE
MIVNPINAQFTNNHLADKVLGQDDFFSSDLGVGENKFEEPIGIAIDFTNGKMYVADSENNRVLRFSYPITSSNQAAELVFGQPDFYANGDTIVARNRMDDPKGIAVDHTGRLWVVDNQNHRVIWFNDAYAITTNQPDADGVLGQTTFETEYFTTSQSGMDHPKGIAISPTGTLFVSDEDNDRILRFDNAANKANGANADGVLGQLDFASNGSGTTQASFDDPYGICLDNAGRLWVADRSNNRVLRFDNAANKANGANADGVLGQADFVSNDDSTSQARMDNPENVAVDNQGRLYVVDIGNQRILIFNDAANQPNGVDAHGVFGQPDFISDNEGSSQTDLHLDQLSFIVYDNRYR